MIATHPKISKTQASQAYACNKDQRIELIPFRPLHNRYDPLTKKFGINRTTQPRITPDLGLTLINKKPTTLATARLGAIRTSFLFQPFLVTFPSLEGCPIRQALGSPHLPFRGENQEQSNSTHVGEP